MSTGNEEHKHPPPPYNLPLASSLPLLKFPSTSYLQLLNNLTEGAGRARKLGRHYRTAVMLFTSTCNEQHQQPPFPPTTSLCPCLPLYLPPFRRSPNAHHTGS